MDRTEPRDGTPKAVLVVSAAWLATAVVIGALALGHEYGQAAPARPRTEPTTPAQKPVGLRVKDNRLPAESKTTQAPESERAKASAMSVVASALAANGIPETAYKAYVHAAEVIASEQPGCGLHWSLLAGIGKVESGHGRGKYLADGTVAQPILGPSLDGSPGVARIVDANGEYVRATGPMQFLPSSWAPVASDGNGDGVKDINNMYDAALGAAKYLCRGGGDLRDESQRRAAVFRYNQSQAYVNLVLAIADSYRTGEPVRATESILPAPLPQPEQQAQPVQAPESTGTSTTSTTGTTTAVTSTPTTTVPVPSVTGSSTSVPPSSSAASSAAASSADQIG
ncbi:lytic transglycosylase domain-containing protein [Lentzea aerocolonigenes]|uniref:lytic transglycosylase domain-containing protein n=1 Tax=Lentzea aerocolonigenes TaxID=68170 RepID=UPI0006981D5A|nr:lytic transglycosylase domain-containing protein [Lentzea aerocolonigenes]